MFRLFSCLALILTHSVAAQAGSFAGVARIETQKWSTQYTGQTELDGLPVTVNFDVFEAGLGLRDTMALVNIDTVIPSFKPDSANAARLNFIVSHNPRVQSAYEVKPQLVSMDGTPRSAYVSQFGGAKDFSFLVTSQDDGTLLVNFTRKLAQGGTASGQIVLAPVATVR